MLMLLPPGDHITNHMRNIFLHLQASQSTRMTHTHNYLIYKVDQSSITPTTNNTFQKHLTYHSLRYFLMAKQHKTQGPGTFSPLCPGARCCCVSHLLPSRTKGFNQYQTPGSEIGAKFVGLPNAFYHEPHWFTLDYVKY